MRFLSKIRERQFAKKWGGAYNLSRAVLAGVLAAGCLMPGFAEAALVLETDPENLISQGLITVVPTEGENTTTITAVDGDYGAKIEIYWAPNNDQENVKGCTINVNNINSPNMTINPEICIIGGDAYDGNAISNIVNISNVTFARAAATIMGGYSDYGEANGNSVSISGGSINGVVIGGQSYEGTATNNNVFVSGGSINGVVIGGQSYEGTATNNNVFISGGNFDSYVFGGYSDYGTVTNNKVIISDGNFYNYVIGGGQLFDRGGQGQFNYDPDDEYGKTVADGNRVIISGGTFLGIYGGYVQSDSGEATNNKVILVGDNAAYKFTDTQGDEHILPGGNINIQGYVSGGWSKGDHSGNQLHVYGSGTTVGGIANFDKLYFYINNKMTSDDVMLTITSDSVTDISKSKVLVTFDGAPPAKDDLKPITLIQKTDEDEKSIIKAPSKDNITVNFGPALTGSVDLNNSDKDLVLTLKNITVNENGKSLVETRAAAAFVVNNMSDFMLGTGMEQAKAAAGGVTPIDAGTMAPFAAVGGSNMRYTTGSYVDVNGWNGAVGFAKQADKLLFGVAVEHGRGNYDSYLDNGVHASGDIKSTGGVIFGEYKLDNGVHYDAALRAGRVKSDYSSTATSYDESSTYYGFSLGGGKELTVSDKATLDVYGRYYFSHTNGSDVSIATGEEIDFDAVNSHRLRIGGRYTTTLTEKSKAYAGLAWQYEFGGDAKAAINGYSAPTPSLQGHSAIVEAGYKLNAGKNLTLDFNLNGAMGKQRGIGGGIGAQWLF